MDVPYISPKLSVETELDPKSEGFKETIEFHLAVPIGECDLSPRDFGMIVRKPNYFHKPIPRLLCFHNYESAEGFDLDYRELPIDRSKRYVLSEILIFLNPRAQTTMMSHEGEIFEAVDVIGPGGLTFRTADVIGGKKTSKMFQAGESFFSVRPKSHYKSNQTKPASESFDGFYHRLENPASILNISHIALMAEMRMAMNNVEFMKYGIKRPPNTWKE